MIRKGLIGAVILGIVFLAGCTGEEGAAQGVTDGVSAAVAALIQAPVDAWLAATFP